MMMRYKKMVISVEENGLYKVDVERREEGGKQVIEELKKDSV